MFFYGLLCGALVAFCLLVVFCVMEAPEEEPDTREQPSPGEHRERQERENRNFLYYDGTNMPTKKEER